MGKLLKIIFYSFVFIIALFLFIGATRIDVKIYSYYKYVYYQRHLDPKKIPFGSSNLEVGSYGIRFIYKGKLPSPDKNGIIKIRNDCNLNSNNINTPHYYTVCLPEYGIVPEEIFLIHDIKPLFENVYYIHGSTYDYFITTLKE